MKLYINARLPKSGNILKRGFFCGTCELTLYTIKNYTLTNPVIIKETNSVSSFRDSTFWILTDEEVQRMVLPRII